MIEGVVAASNGKFAGVTSFYVEADGIRLEEFAIKLKGFPKTIEQVEEQEFGFTEKEITQLKNEKRNPNISFIRLKFYCYDHFGHTAVQITLREDNWVSRDEAIGRVSFELKFDPAQLDEFTQGLSMIAKRKQNKAVLNGRAT